MTKKEVYTSYLKEIEESLKEVTQLFTEIRKTVPQEKKESFANVWRKTEWCKILIRL